MKSIATYVKNPGISRIVLWCYFIWYLVMAAFYFVPTLGIWLTSLGISALVGIALTLNTVSPDRPIRPSWQLFRLFLIPFCVSSFSSLAKDRGFFLIFSPKPVENEAALALCAGFLLAVALARRRSSELTSCQRLRSRTQEGTR
jgi:energy-converting hydrogenase Eha subunit A